MRRATVLAYRRTTSASARQAKTAACALHAGVPIASEAKARAADIAHYGLECIACGFDFALVYGEIRKAFIHVHHVVPLSQTKVAYKADLINDLRPVCANCHAIIHRSTPALSILEVIDAFNARRESFQTA